MGERRGPCIMQKLVTRNQTQITDTEETERRGGCTGTEREESGKKVVGTRLILAQSKSKDKRLGTRLKRGKKWEDITISEGSG